MKKVLYIDMDNVLVDYQSGIDSIDDNTRKEFEGHLNEIPGIFLNMKPMPGAIEAFQTLLAYYNVFIISTAPWNSPLSWSDKLTWVKRNVGNAYKRLILTYHKNLIKGDFLIDDRTTNGAAKFEGELILFGSDKFPNWETVVKYLIDLYNKRITDSSKLDTKCDKGNNKTLYNNIVSPLQENAFTEPVMHQAVLSKIDFELPDIIWDEINEGFANYWNKEVGLGNDAFFNDACTSIDAHLKSKLLIFSLNKLVRVVEIMFDFIEQIPGVLIDNNKLI